MRVLDFCALGGELFGGLKMVYIYVFFPKVRLVIAEDTTSIQLRMISSLHVDDSSINVI